MIDAKNPIAGKAYSDTVAGPNNAALKAHKAPAANARSTRRLSNSFSRTNPTKQPTVIIPQNHDTALAPVVCGSKPWYSARNFEIQSAVPCSEPTYASMVPK